MYNIAVVGTGIISSEHLEAIEKSEEFCLCGLCDIDETRVKRLAERYQVPYVTDYHIMPDELDMDAVIINLPHYLHKEATVFFLNAGIHVLVEKPMANTVEECDAMLKAAAENSKKLAVGHVQRFYQVNMEVKKRFTSKEYGEFCMFSETRTIDYFQESRPAWFTQKEKAGGGVVMNYGAHAIDKLSYLLGEFPTEILACCGNRKNDRNVEGHAQILLKYPKGESASITFDGYDYSGYQVLYYFTDGVIKVDGNRLLSSKDGNWENIGIYGDGKHMERQLAAFGDYLAGRPSQIADGNYGRNVIAVIEKIYE